MTHRSLSFLLAAIATLVTACGYGYQRTSLSMGPNASRTAREDPTFRGDMSAGMGLHVISLVDTSGAFTAHMGTLGNKFTAEREARERAARDPRVKAGDRISYSYERVAPVPGRMTNIRFFWGGTEGVEIAGTSMDSYKASAWGLDVDEGLGGFAIGMVDVSLNIGARFQKWKVETGGAYEDVNEWRLNLPLMLSVGYHLRPDLHLSVNGNLDTVSAITGLADQPAWLDAQVGALVRWTPIRFASVGAETAIGKQSWDVGGREVGVFTAGAFLSFHAPTSTE